MQRQDYDPAELGAGVYPFLNSVVVPRPIAWISTRSAAGVDNLAPHSFFSVASVNPPVVSFTSVGEKDSLRNIRETGEFVISLAPENLFEAVNATGTGFTAEGTGQCGQASDLRPRPIGAYVAGQHQYGRLTQIVGRVRHPPLHRVAGLVTGGVAGVAG